MYLLVLIDRLLVDLYFLPSLAINALGYKLGEF